MSYKETMKVELPLPFELPSGDIAEEAVVRVLTIKERMDMGKKYQGDQIMFAFESLRTRILRLGSLDGPVVREVMQSMPAPTYDELQEATLALDLGFESLEEFRASEKYKEF